MKRSAGILLPISSLPSNYGIGTLGKEAYKFVDFLKEAKQSYWQTLPVGPTSLGDSPYQSFSSFAGNPYFIDLDLLIEDGLLTSEDVKDLKNDQYIDYGYLYNTRYKVLHIAYLNGINKDKEEFESFIKDNPNLKDYAFYMALKKHFNNKCWIEWPMDIRKREEASLNKYYKLLKEDIEFNEYIQYLFFKQFYALKKYMNDSGIKLIGDIPIYVSLDSCDCWKDPECFKLDDEYIPTAVAGVPPDYFSKDGQLWGNPLYDYDYMKTNGYKWWIDRISGSSKLFDVIRIDHFRGFDTYWSVPYGDQTARNGKWIEGPNMELVNIFKNWFYNVEFIAEDLGILSDSVRKMLKESGFPGMKVLEFAFNAKEPSEHDPHTYTNNCVCYVGTHDNSTLKSWLKITDKENVDYALKYLGLKDTKGFNWQMIKAGMSSVANLFIARVQDYLDLDDEARINTPGTLGENWKWRLKGKELDSSLSKKIAEYTTMYGRSIEPNKK